MPTKTPSSSSTATATTCFDTPGWEDKDGDGCDYYEERYDLGCSGTDWLQGDMGPATDHCCYCKNPSVRLIYFGLK